ncbi:hypothetical protein PACTADRAFT_33376 [Pachysolen tannophilus NRRL Y-2460]|uniref:Uncharacterized protein n=1 Tax=Pachysolen tannophilus NRRL Y-2460 TaxID=669874 RepID=A0A1E4TX10_PACTA|nr:hypothetical protein PACTADRAFT_33376 [Pachysolen tannophilus NRRL Y-2460]
MQAVISYPTGVNKREPIKEVIYNKDYLEQLDEKKKAEEEYEVTEQPRSWIRTIYETKVEIVQPTVIAGVTFSAKPPESTNGLEPWISLNNAGVPKTVTPQAKNGNIKKGKPQYSTWFQTATTKIYDQKELKAHNMKEGSKFEEVIYLPEDETYVSLNPLIRCTPDNYYKKGKAKNILSQPFENMKTSSKYK